MDSLTAASSSCHFVPGLPLGVGGGGGVGKQQTFIIEIAEVDLNQADALVTFE